MSIIVAMAKNQIPTMHLGGFFSTVFSWSWFWLSTCPILSSWCYEICITVSLNYLRKNRIFAMA